MAFEKALHTGWEGVRERWTTEWIVNENMSFLLFFFTALNFITWLRFFWIHLLSTVFSVEGYEKYFQGLCVAQALVCVCLDDDSACINTENDFPSYQHTKFIIL